ncbi:MAG: 16S rRNA (guanine(966)-N(2))-methyltransferase RsmD [Desulfovibrio sp.]|jgi:16S rRNA (guanine966-N2)-methyltransferase|nr:16S rRNA (guanine(966)-N(2))-methyltransferase RsmD [Desulfovibrio sp.]
MRIIAGELGGRPLKSARGEGLRPAMGRTREALFSMLAARGIDWPGSRVLDVFAGSGSLAFEAVSRGAPSAVLVENADNAVRRLRENIAALGIQDRARVVRGEALRFLRRAPITPVDLVFLDPPYGKNLIAPSLALLMPRLAPGAFVAAELEKEADPGAPDDLELAAERFFGRTRLCLWRRRGRK